MGNTYFIGLKNEVSVALDNVKRFDFQEESGSYAVIGENEDILGIYPVHSLAHITRQKDNNPE